jgi:molybdopterin-binding protein
VVTYRTTQAAELLGVSADTVRRWAESGRLASSVGEDGKRYFEGEDLAAAAVAMAESPSLSSPRAQSARNRFVGIVTRVTKDAVVAQVDIQAGPHRFVSVITREAADELGLAPGVVVDTVIKATSVSVEIPGRY